ncbi:MAG: hypothetical protein AB7L17_22470 [Ilumatobacteraceae bacterium]
MTTTNQPGVTLTCTNDDCPCELQINVACPHGDTYTCACGHRLVAARPRSGETLGERVQQEGIVDQQAVVLDEAAADG